MSYLLKVMTEKQYDQYDQSWHETRTDGPPNKYLNAIDVEERCTYTLSKWNIWQQVLCVFLQCLRTWASGGPLNQTCPRCPFAPVCLQPSLRTASPRCCRFLPSACTLCARRASPKTCPLPSVRGHRNLPEVIDYMLHVWLCSSSSRFVQSSYTIP